MKLTDAGTANISGLAGVGTRVVNVDSSGNLVAGVAAGSAVDGSGTTNYVPRWSDSNTLTDSRIIDNGTQYLFGATAVGTRDGEIVHNNGGTSAQYANMVARGTTTDDTVTEIFLNNTSPTARIYIATDSVSVFDVVHSI